MAAVPIYVWNGTAWQETGPTIPASPIKYQASAPSSPSTGDIWVDSDGDVTSGSTQLQRFRFVASGGETSLSGNDANGATLAYTAGMEQVVLNGAVLVRGHDYTATNGTSITGLSPALVANDVVEVFSFMAFNVANTYTQSQVDGLIAAIGLVHLGTTNFSAVSSQPITFASSTYKNYKIIMRWTQSASGAMSLRVRSGSTDYTGAEYNSAAWYARSAGGSGANFVTLQNQTIATLTGANNGYDSGSTLVNQLELLVTNLFEATSTSFFENITTGDTTGNTVSIFGSHRVREGTSRDGLNFILGAGTMTGTIQIFGVKE
jgi:hypothetical protein